MDNLKYPKVSYLHNEASVDDVFDVIGTNHAWKDDGHIIPETDLREKSITNLGVSTGHYMQVTKPISCPINCEFQVGFAVKRKYRTPGKGNAYPINHPYSRPYYVTVSEEEVVSGELTEAAMRKVELALMVIIQADVDMKKEADFFNVRKVAYTTGAGDVTITDSEGNSSLVTLAEGDLFGDKIVAVMIAADEYMLIGIENGYYFGVESGTAIVASQGLALIGNWGKIHFDTHSLKNFAIDPFYIYQLAVVNGSASTKSLYENGTYIKFDSADNAELLVGFVDGGKLSGVVSVAHASVIITSGTQNPANYIDLPVNAAAAAAYPLRRYKAVSGAGTWPTNSWEDIDRRFIGRYAGMEGAYQNRAIKDELYGIMQYVLEGTSPSLSSGASSSEGFSTRVDEVLSFYAIQNNPKLAAIFATIV